MSMKNYIDADRNLYAYEADGSQDEFILPGLVLISDEEASAIVAEQEKAKDPSDEQLRHEVMTKCDQLLTVAGLRIAPLQDAVDLGKGTADTKEGLKRWKQYRIDVDAAAQKAESLETVSWPDQPQ